MKRETETDLEFWFRFFLMAGNVNQHGNLGEPELFSIFINFHYTLVEVHLFAVPRLSALQCFLVKCWCCSSLKRSTIQTNCLPVPVAYLAHVQLADSGPVVDPLLTDDVHVASFRPRGLCGVVVPVSFTPVASRRSQWRPRRVQVAMKMTMMVQ